MDKVQITEVGLRDGLQNLCLFVPTQTKKHLLDLLIMAGIKKIEATAFVNPKVMPQMADAKELAGYAAEQENIQATALVATLSGARQAKNCQIKEINYVISVSPEHNQANLKRTHEQSLTQLQLIKQELPELTINVSLATAFGCPFTGLITPQQVLLLWEKCSLLGADTLTLADTIGVANPRQTQDIVSLMQKNFPNLSIALHLHDTHGMALTNYYVALQLGITRFETSMGGLGGCPFAPGAAGNAATEDLVNMLHRMGIATNIKLDKYLELLTFLKSVIKEKLPSHMANARSYSEFDFYLKPER